MTAAPGTVAGPLLLVGSALLHAAWNALLKREGHKDVAAVAVLAVATALTGLLVPFSSGRAFASGAAVGWAVGAGLFEGAYFVTLAAALARAPLGLAYTVARGGAMLLVWPISVLALGERAGLASFAGAALVAGGLAVMQLERTGPSSGRLGWAWACAAAIAGYHLCYGRALGVGAQPIPLFALSLAVALPVNLAALGRRGFRDLVALLRERPAPMLVAGALSSGSFLAFLVGLASAGAGAALTLRNTSVVFAQGFALALGERVGARQLLGALLVAAGAALVALPH